MKKSEIKKLTQEILDNLSNQGRVSEILADIIADNNKLEDNLVSINEEIATIKGDNESLRKANNKLFVQLGNQDEEEGGAEEEEKDQEQESKLPSLEDLDL